jgi:dethiobiotin synthetase
VKGVFVSGTDTEVGKTVVASAIAATLADKGERVAVFKPVVTGLEQAPPESADHELLRRSARSTQAPEGVSPYRFEPPLSPHLAAELAGIEIGPGHLIACAEAAASGAETLVVEGVGGFMVPLSADCLVRDFAAELGLPVVVAARPRLGTINHTLMTLECVRTAGLDVAAVVFTPWPEGPNLTADSNRRTIERLGRVETFCLPRVEVRGSIAPVHGLPAARWVGTAAQRKLAA